MNKILIQFWLIFLSLVLTIISSFLPRESLKITWNLCDITIENPWWYCYEYLPEMWFPLIYLSDSPATSVTYNLGLEDDFYMYNLIFNIIFYYILLSLLIFLLNKYKWKNTP